MNIDKAIGDWDGKSKDQIETIYMRYVDHKQFIPSIINACDVEALQKGSTWLLKRYLEKGRTLSKTQTHKFISSLDLLRHWESVLHALQCLQYLKISNQDLNVVETFLRSKLEHKNKFVRAWTYSSLYDLSIQFEEFQQEVLTLLETAMKDEAPSVKARIRSITKGNH